MRQNTLYNQLKAIKFYKYVFTYIYQYSILAHPKFA